MDAADAADFRDRGATDQPDLAPLVRRAQAKDPDAFTDLIRRYERIVLSIAFASLGARPGDGERAGDIVQEAFARAWERLGELNDPSRFAPWLCGIVRNLAIDARRRLRLTPRSQTDVTPDGAAPLANAAAMPGRSSQWAPDPADELEAREREQLLQQALAELDDTSRPVVTLRYYQGLSSKEIGELLDLAPTAVDMRLSRARQQLKKKLLASQAFAEEAG